MRIVVLGGDFGGIEVVNELVGLRKQIQVALDWWLAGFFPRDSAVMRQPRRCAVCAEVHAPRETHAA
jgi:hypothetical protein